MDAEEYSKAEFDRATEAGGVTGPGVKQLMVENEALKEEVKFFKREFVRLRKQGDVQQRFAQRQRVLGMMEGTLHTLNNQNGVQDPLNAPVRPPTGVVGLLNLIVSYLRSEADADMFMKQSADAEEFPPFS